MAYRVTLFSNAGKPLDEINASIHVAWAMNAVTRAEFTMSALDAKCTERNLRFGNFVLFEHDLLPSWGGYIWSPRQWEPKIVTVGMVSGEGMLERRIAPKAGLWEGKPAGMFRRAIDSGNSHASMNVVAKPDDIKGGKGTPLTIELREQALIDVVNEIQESSSYEWWFEPFKDDDRDLFFKANWRERRGRRREYVLIEGKNFAASRVAEEGNLYNDVSVLGEGLVETSPDGHARNPKSRDLFGLTQYSETMSVEDEASLEARADEIIAKESFPKLNFSGVVFGTDAFGKFGLGDDLTVQFSTMGFWGKSGTGATIRARVMSMEYKSEENALACTFEEMPTVGNKDNNSGGNEGERNG
jgi:hypothetical protein